MDINKLKQLAERVYIKDWVLDTKFYRVVTQHGETIAEAARLQFAEFMAAATPNVILELIRNQHPRRSWVIRYSDTYFGGFQRDRWEIWTTDSKKATRFSDHASAQSVVACLIDIELTIKEIDDDVTDN